jgi:hypothetical protein
VVSLRSGWGVGRRAIARSSRGSACRGGRGCGGRLLLIVLLAMRRLRCHGGHGGCSVLHFNVWMGCTGGGGPEIGVEWALAGRELALVPAGSRCCRLRVGKSEAATER